MAPSAHDLLAGVVAPRAAGFVGPHALAVDDQALGEAARPLRRDRSSPRRGSAPRPRLHPARPQTSDRACLGRRVARQKPPGIPPRRQKKIALTISRRGEEAVAPSASAPAATAPPAAAPHPSMGFVSKSLAAMLPASGWGPRRSLQAGLNTSFEIADAQPLNLSGTALSVERFQVNSYPPALKSVARGRLAARLLLSSSASSGLASTAGRSADPRTASGLRGQADFCVEGERLTSPPTFMPKQPHQGRAAFPSGLGAPRRQPR